MRARASHILLPGCTAAVAILAWYGVTWCLDSDHRFLLPNPTQVLDALWEHRAILGRAALNTTTGATFGLAAAVIASSLLSLTMSISSLIRASLYPYLMILQMVPVIVIAPMLVIWVGPGTRSVTVITVLICFFPLVVNTTQGLISTDRDLVELFRMWRTSKWQQLVHLRIPAALPYFFTGLRIAAVLAPIGALVGDYTAGSSAGDGGGLGFQTIVFSSQAQYPALLATAVVTCVLGFLFAGLVSLASWMVLHRWHDAYARTD